MLIDEYLSSYDVVERHHLAIDAPAHVVFDAVRALDLSDSRIVRWLFRLRELPGWCRPGSPDDQPLGLTLQDLIASGFIMLGERLDEEIVLGVVGRFWTPRGSIRRMDAEAFTVFASPGYAKAAWNFSVSQASEGVTKLATETRVLCLDKASRRIFKLYWALIAPFSGAIRMEALRSIKRAAEARASDGAL
jgi:hypothetical protein